MKRALLGIAALTLGTGLLMVARQPGGDQVTKVYADGNDTDSEPNEPSPATFIVYGTVTERYVRNVKDHPERPTTTGDTADARDRRETITAGRWRGWYEVDVERWEQIEGTDALPTELRMRGNGTIVLSRGVVIPPQAGESSRVFTFSDVPIDGFEQVEVGKEYAFRVSEDRLFGRYFYLVSEFALLAE